MATKRKPSAPKPAVTESPKVAAPKYNPTRWNDPDASFAPDDESLEARLWRQAQHQEGK